MHSCREFGEYLSPGWDLGESVGLCQIEGLPAACCLLLMLCAGALVELAARCGMLHPVGTGSALHATTPLRLVFAGKMYQ